MFLFYLLPGYLQIDGRASPRTPRMLRHILNRCRFDRLVFQQSQIPPSTQRSQNMPFLRINCKRIYYRDSPPDSGGKPRETFVLCHGLGSSHNFYTAITPSLTAQNYRCISLDTTGSGLSSYTHIEQSIHTLAVDVIDVMDALSIPKAVLIGHSMSGLTVPYLAINWPDRVSAIILLGPVLPSEDVARIFEQRISTIAARGMDAMADTVPWTALGSKARPLHKAFVRTLILGTSPEGYISLCKVIASAYKLPPDYSKVACPALLIAGEEDKSAPLPGCERIFEAMGTEEKSMVVQKGIGHWMCVEASEEVGSEIVKFMRQTK